MNCKLYPWWAMYLIIKPSKEIKIRKRGRETLIPFSRQQQCFCIFVNFLLSLIPSFSPNGEKNTDHVILQMCVHSAP